MFAGRAIWSMTLPLTDVVAHTPMPPSPNRLLGTSTTIAVTFSPVKKLVPGELEAVAEAVEVEEERIVEGAGAQHRVGRTSNNRLTTSLDRTNVRLMDIEMISHLGRQLAATDISTSELSECRSLLEEIRRAQAALESHKLAVIDRITELGTQHPEVLPEQIVADATRVTLSKALEPFKRVNAVKLLPDLAPALATGDISTEHVDVVARAVGQLSNDIDRARFAARSEFLVGVAARTNPTEFGRTVRAELQRAQRDNDGIATLQRQREATSLRTWIDQTTGMWCLHGEFDPETGVTLHRRLSNTIEKLFHDSHPATCPTDPLRKQDHLRALALVAMTDGNGVAAKGQIDISVLIDARTLATGPHDRTIIDCGIPIQLPVESIRRMLCTADVTPIVVGADGTRLYLGRTTRLASADQRKVLRALYRTCAITGCCVAWDQLIIHHLREYVAHNGPSDIDNLLPLCVRHHHLAHEGGWKLHVAADRTLTINLPDGTVMTTGPPNVWAA